MSPMLKRLIIYTVGIFLASSTYYFYIVFFSPQPAVNETFLTEVGEGFGEAAMWVFIAIYIRTVLKLIMGKGPISRRLLPNYTMPAAVTPLKRIMVHLDKTHVYFGVAGLALALVHIAFVGLHSNILFFPIVLGLIIWQGLFGFFLSWKGSPKNLKKVVLWSPRPTYFRSRNWHTCLFWTPSHR